MAGRSEDQVRTEIAAERASLAAAAGDLRETAEEIEAQVKKFRSLLPVLGGAGAVLRGAVKGGKKSGGPELFRLGPFSIRLRGK